MIRRRSAFIALLFAFLLVAAACGDSGTTTTDSGPVVTQGTSPDTTLTDTTLTQETPATILPTTTLPPPPPDASVLACQVSDTGGIDDKSFNETAWNGALRAQDELQNVTVEFLESQAPTDFTPNIDSFIAQGCDLITTVGFLLAGATADAAVDNPDQLFAIIDQAPGPFPPWTDDDGNARSDWFNLRGITFQTDEAAFLAGYLAAGVTETGVVGTFGGINIPPVTIFMNGFVRGVNHYNAEKGTEVVVLGWDVEAQDGLFTQNFESLDDGRTFAQTLIDQDADVILPVAGPVGLGSAAVCQETEACLIIGVDADQFVVLEAQDDPLRSVFLTSIKKNMDVAVFNTINNVLTLDAVGNLYVGTLANGGVGLAPFHDLADQVPADLASELTALEAAIIAGSVAVN